MTIQENIYFIQEEIEKYAKRFGHRKEDITLLAVSKTISEEKIQEALDAGIQDLGENRVQEILRKEEILRKARLHMIGQLQSNKVRQLAGKVDLIHSLDRPSLLKELEKIGKRENLTFSCLLQINVGMEVQKGGMKVDDIQPFLDKVEDLSYVKIKGLMTVAPFAENPEDIRWVFRDLRKRFEKLTDIGYNNSDMKILSMGMSNDYKIALEEGATMLRIGSAIFGQRK